MTVTVSFSRNVSLTSSFRSGGWFYCSAPTHHLTVILLPFCSSNASFIASGQDRTDRGLRMERISVGTDMHGIWTRKIGRIWTDPPTHAIWRGLAKCFFQAMEKRRVWGTNCHLRHVASGFSNLRGMLASKQWKLMVVSADYPSADRSWCRCRRWQLNFNGWVIGLQKEWQQQELQVTWEKLWKIKNVNLSV